MQELRLNIDSIPGAILRYHDGSSLQYPKEWPIDYAHISRFCDMYMSSNQNQSLIANQSQSVSHPLPTVDTGHYQVKEPDLSSPVYKAIASLTMLRSPTFNYTMLQTQKHVLVYFFQSLHNTSTYSMNG